MDLLGLRITVTFVLHSGSVSTPACSLLIALVGPGDRKGKTFAKDKISKVICTLKHKLCHSKSLFMGTSRFSLDDEVLQNWLFLPFFV